MSPMMEQYFQVKNQYKDFLLFYRIGDFYEMFYDDAIVASRVLDLTLTGKICGETEKAPMCGVPFHAADIYIGKLIEKGYKVAVCEQTEDPAKAVGLVKREVIRVVTPGTVTSPELLPEQRNNYLCALYQTEYDCALCFADVSTAQVYATSFDGSNMQERMKNELATYQPAEIICNLSKKHLGETAKYIATKENMMLTDNQSERFSYEPAKEAVLCHFADTVTENQLENRPLICCIGALISYLSETEKTEKTYLKELNIYSDREFLEMDGNTRRNLELTESMRTKEKKGSLLWVLDKTGTSAGARCLRKWVEHPLLDAHKIVQRQDAVEELTKDYLLRENLSEALSHVLDLERLITRVVYGTANARDLRAVGNTVSLLPEIKDLLKDCKSEELVRIYQSIDPLNDVRDAILSALVEDPPLSVREGGLINDGYNEEADRLRDLSKNGKERLEELAEKEREKTGIKTMKLGFNRVFGYYLEVTNSLKNMVPAEYIRKQTLSGGERYITEELKQLENTILGAEDKLCALEYELFAGVRNFTAERSARITETAVLVSELDAYLSLALVAGTNHYVRPEINQREELVIRDGRHPVVEQFVKDTYFVPNDTELDTGNNRLALITGPNMAGKSTYMRQVALITVMAQIGSFVPAKEASIGIVDKVFTRVGASDDLASGQSTFMLEMNEVAYILKNATRKSLIIYDEVGRGTSTYDGMSIARAIVEYTASRKIGAKTLFATHYHELTAMEGQYDGIVNYNIAAKKRGDSITFLRKIVRGSTDDSYGIEVAKLAGIPNEITKRAKEILSSVEKTAKAVTEIDREEEATEEESNLSFDSCMDEAVIAELKATDLNALTPFECMSFLFELKKKLGN